MKYRLDGRSSDSIRDISINFSSFETSSLINSPVLTMNASSTSEFSIGGTTALCSIFGPGQGRYQRHEHWKNLVIEVELTLVGTKTVMRKVKSVQSDIKKILNLCIETDYYPRSLLVFKIDVTSLDGNYMSCSIMAAVCALISSGIRMKGVPVAMSLCVFEDEFFLDPTEEEETKCDGILSIVSLPFLENGECQESIVFQLALGKISTGTYENGLRRLMNQASDIRNLIRSSLLTAASS